VVEECVNTIFLGVETYFSKQVKRLAGIDFVGTFEDIAGVLATVFRASMAW
jgi:hypothetical protein